MTTIMNQVTCSQCNIKVDEKKWGEHLIPTEHLEICKDDKVELGKSFFDLIFDTYHNRSEIYYLKNEKAQYSWEGYFESLVAKEKFDQLCSDSIDKSELEDSLITDLRSFINNYSYDIGELHFDTLDKITSCRIRNTEVHESRFFDHIISEGHRVAEKYFIMKCMTYCERFDKEIKNDMWRKHLTSYNHTRCSGEQYCEICKKNYNIVRNGVHSKEKERDHLERDIRKKNENRLGYHAS